jgi:hypothetical protein
MVDESKSKLDWSRDIADLASPVDFTWNLFIFFALALANGRFHTLPSEDKEIQHTPKTISKPSPSPATALSDNHEPLVIFS